MRFDWHNAENAIPAVCIIFTVDDDGQQEQQIAQCDNEQWAERIVNALNATLGLLEACQEAAAAHAHLETCNMPSWLDMIENAIAKATS